MCVLTGLCTGKYEQIMRWWSSRLGQELLQSYNLSLIVMYFYPASPDTLVPTLATTRGRLPTRVFPVSIPASTPITQGHPTTRASPVSTPESRIPAILLYLPLVPTTWLSLPVASYSLLPVKFLPRLPVVVYIKLQLNRYKLLWFIWLLIHQVLLFGILFIIFLSLIVEIFVFIDRISFHWSWNFSSGVIVNFLWAVSKLEIWICSPCRFVEGHGEGPGWAFRLIHFNWFLCLI